MKKATLILAVIASFALFSCGGNTNNEDSTQGETTKNENSNIENSKIEQVEKEKENVYVKDKYEKDLGLKSTENKFSQKDWDQISRVCTAYQEFKKSTDVYKATVDEWETFFIAQRYANLEEGKNDILIFKALYKVSLSIPTEIGGLNSIKKLYGEEQYKLSLIHI